MKKSHFLKILVIFIVLCLLSKEVQGIYCSAYCSYYNLGAAYTPMCTDQTSFTCTKCDETLFAFDSAGQCVPHVKFNETLQRIDLNPAISSLVDWISLNNLYHLNTVSGLYSTVEFYQDASVTAGGNDLIYKIFTNLQAHFTVRLRFFVIRSASSTMQFSYYLDNKKFDYNYNQYPSNTTLGDIITTDKILHQNSNLTVGFQAKFVAGVTEYIGIKELLVFISRCSLYCQFCSNSTNCVKCTINGPGAKTYLYKGQCYLECPQQTFAQDTTQTCQPCQAQCQNCIGTSTNCTQCKFEGKHQTFLLNNSCFYTCPDGYFKDFDTNQCICPVNGYYINSTNNLCQPCANECNSCFGPSKNQCYNCSVGNFLIFGTTWCSTTCPSGQYGDQFAKKCFHCSSTCSECVNSSSQCVACFFKKSTRYLYNSQCLTQCPTGHEKNFSLRKCVQCLPFYYSFNGQCLVQCPQNYIANNQTKSCLHITQTNFTLISQAVGIEVLMKGKLVLFSVSFSQGLSSSSKSWLSSQGYYNTKLHIGQLSILTSNIKLQQEKVYTFSFNLQQQLDELTLMTIDFGTRLNTQQNISYSRTTAQFSLSSNPEMLGEYYTKSQANYLNVMFIPALLIMFVLIVMRSKQSYELLIESVRALQLMALAVFISYPLQSSIFSLLQGLNYFNLQFFPNVYNQFVPIFQNSLKNNVQFFGFRFLYGDMDFIRMIGSILVFIAVWIILIVILKVFFTKNNLILGWLLRIGMELIEIKILHSFWNSLIFTIINSSQNNIYILWLHLFSYVFMGFTIFRYYKVYQENGTISYTFLWRLIATLLLSVAVYQQMVFLIVLSLISVAFGFQHYRSQKSVLNSVQKFRYSIAFKLRAFLQSFLPLLSILGISLLVFYREQFSVLACQIIIGALGYFIVVMNVIVVILLRYYFKMRENKHVKVSTGKDGGASKRILEKQNMQENIKYQPTPKQDLQTILSKDDNTIVTQKQVFIKDQFEADFHNAHRMTIPDLEDSHRQNQTTYERSNYNQSTFGLMQSSIKNQLANTQQKSKVKPLKRFSQNKIIQSWQSNKYQDESIFEDEPAEGKFPLAHRTQAIRKSKTKLAPLQTIDIQKQVEAQIQKIQLTKRTNVEDKNFNKPMNSIKLLTQEGFKRLNTDELQLQVQKKDSPGVIYYEKEEPRRNLQGAQQLRLRSNVFLRDQQESP